MKRNELKVGQSYFYSSLNGWRQSGYGEKVTVLSLDNFEVLSLIHRVKERQHTDSDGNAFVLKGAIHPTDSRVAKVLVESGYRQFLAPLGHLRGPWEDALRVVEAELKLALEARDELGYEIRDGLRSAGLIDTAHHSLQDGETVITLSVEDAERMLAFVNAHGGRI